MTEDTRPTEDANGTPPAERPRGPPLTPSHGISIELDAATPTADGQHPPLPVRHMSDPAYQSPIRHHKRAPSRSKGVKETLNARSHYGSSDDDGGAIHRINQYVIKQEIGRGSFGAVHLAVDQFGHEYAVKEFSKSRLRKRAQSNLLRKPNYARRPGHLAAGVGFNSPLHRQSSSDRMNGENNNSLNLIKEEIAIMKKLDHHNLVALIEVLDDPQEDSLYMVLEMCKKGVVMKVGLEERATPYEEEACRCWFRDMILGIEYLHAQGIVHRDIKPDNCLITQDDVLKIVDFGVSEMFEKESDMHTAKSAGSPAFMPPELCVARHGPVSGRAVDIWSMGVTLYCLRYGRIPFEKSGMLELYESIKNDDAPLEQEQNQHFRDLMHRLLDKDPETRITMDELRTHAWVTKGGTDPLLSAEENCADLVEPPTETEMNYAITGNVAHLFTVVKAVRSFKNLLSRKRGQFMEGIFGRESRMTAPPHSVHGPSKSADPEDRKAVESDLATEGIHRHIHEGDILKIPAMDRLNVTDDAPSEDVDQDGRKVGESVAHFKQRMETEKHPPFPDPSHVESPEPEPLHARSRTFPVDEHAKGHARDPLKEKLFLHIGAGADIAEEHDPTDCPVVSESPGGVDDDIYELAYQEEIKRILAEKEEAGLHLTRHVEHIERLRRHPNILASSLNHAIDFAGSTARRLDARARSGGLAALVRDARDRARATVAEAERSETSQTTLLDPESPNAIAASRTKGDELTADEAQSGADGTSPRPGSRQASRSPKPETVRLRDYARSSASSALKGLSKRIEDTASRLDTRGNLQPYPET